MRRFLPLRRFSVAVPALVLLALPALAYVLPAGLVLRRTVEVREELGLSSWRVDGTLSFFGPAASEAFAAGVSSADGQAEAAFALKPPGRCRIEFGNSGGVRSAAVVSRGKTRVEGTGLGPVTLALEHVCAVFGIREGGEADGRAALERHLRGLQVDLGETSLGRLGHRVAYVMGKPAEGAPQFWVFKEGFLPARLRFTDSAGVGWDVRFVDYASPMVGDAFPRLVEVWRGGELWVRFSTRKAELKVTLADRLFAP